MTPRSAIRWVVPVCLCLAGCLEPYELRPALEALETPRGGDFIYASDEDRDQHPNRYFYDVREDVFGPLPRIVLEFRARVEMDMNRDLDESVFDGESRALSQARISLDSGRFHDFVNYRIQLQDSQASFSESVDAQRDHLDIRQAMISLSRSRMLWNVKLGRLEFDAGSGRVLGADWFDNVDRSFDGGRVSFADRWSRFEPRQWSWRVDVFGGAPVESRSLQFNTGHDEPNIGGVFYADQRIHPLAVDASLFVTRIPDGVAGELGGSGPEELVTLSGRLTGRDMGRAEGVDFELEAVVQVGSSGPDSHHATMGAANCSYTFPTPWMVRLFAGVEAASGDDDPLDGRSTGYHPVFPGDLRPGFGLLGLLGQRNSSAWRVGGSFGPFEGFRLGCSVRWLALDTVSDQWYQADGTAAAVTDRYLGREVDLDGRYTFLTESGKEVSIEGGYAVFEPRTALPAATGTIQSLYMQVSFKF